MRVCIPTQTRSRCPSLAAPRAEPPHFQKTVYAPIVGSPCCDIQKGTKSWVQTNLGTTRSLSDAPGAPEVHRTRRSATKKRDHILCHSKPNGKSFVLELPSRRVDGPATIGEPFSATVAENRRSYLTRFRATRSGGSNRALSV